MTKASSGTSWQSCTWRVPRVAHLAGKHHHRQGHDTLSTQGVTKGDRHGCWSRWRGNTRRRYGKTSELAVQSVYKGTGGPVGAYRSISTAAKERIVLERNSGPRLEARKEDKGRRRVARVTPEFAGAVGNLDTSRRIASRGVGTGV